MRQLVNLPEAIAQRVARLHKKGVLYQYAEIHRPGKPSVWREFVRLTIADCEQLVEYHTRRARKAIARLEITGSTRSTRTAADHVYRARLYRWRYHEMIGNEPGEADMPFPLLSEEEAAALAVEEDGPC
ncbi:MAG: hypothetical protein ABIP48_02725 [Planctomycetota bacterium]